MGDEGNARYSPTPAIAVIADTAAGLLRGTTLAELGGGQTAFATDMAGAISRLSSRIHLDVVLLLLNGSDLVEAAVLLEAIGAAARNARYRSVVAVSFESLDAVHGQLDHRDIEILCDPSDTELVGAIGLAITRRAPALHEPKRDRDDGHLLQISEEVGRIARALAELSQSEKSAANGRQGLGEAPFAYRPEPVSAPLLDADRIRQVIRMRRLRDRFFDTGLFADPGWDMLLDLMAARLERRNVAVSSLCIAAAVPPTTALRWIKTMTETGLFERRADPEDGRRIFIALSDDAASAVEAWFAAVRREGGSATA